MKAILGAILALLGVSILLQAANLAFTLAAR